MLAVQEKENALAAAAAEAEAEAQLAASHEQMAKDAQATLERSSAAALEHLAAEHAAALDDAAVQGAEEASRVASDAAASLEALCVEHADAIAAQITAFEGEIEARDVHAKRRAVKRMLRARYIRVFDALSENAETSSARERDEVASALEEAHIAGAVADAQAATEAAHRSELRAHEEVLMRRAVKRMLRVRYINAFNAMCEHVAVAQEEEFVAYQSK